MLSVRGELLAGPTSMLPATVSPLLPTKLSPIWGMSCQDHRSTLYLRIRGTGWTGAGDQGTWLTQVKGTHMKQINASLTMLALVIGLIFSLAFAGDVAAQDNSAPHHGSGKDRSGYCDPTFCPENAAPSKSRGNFLYGEPGVDRRAFPQPGGGPGCTAQSALQTNPSQAAGDNVGYPSAQAADRAQGGPFNNQTCN